MSITDKYRPKSFDEVLGHKNVVQSLRTVLQDRLLLPHAYLFSGPAGVGKTSIARIVATELGCKPFNIIEQDSTLHASEESMRELVSAVRIPAMGTNPYRAVILDEVQDLRKSVWDIILKDVEEPPAHLFWILCTTEPDKLPSRLTTRFHLYALRPLRREVLKQRLVEIKVAEGFDISEEMIDAIVDKCGGSMRGALTMLSAFRDANPESTQELLEAPNASAEMMELCKFIVSGKGRIENIQKLLRQNAEEFRQVLIWYLTKNWMVEATRKEPAKWAEYMLVLAPPLTAGMPELLARLYRQDEYLLV